MAAVVPLRESRRKLTVGPGASWLEMPGAARFDLGRRPTLRRIVQALVQKHAAARGTALGVEELVEAGWPGQRLLHFPATKRVHTAVWSLRRRGLGDLLVTSGDGYMLHPTTVVDVRES
jgi:hypothetical protein